MLPSGGCVAFSSCELSLLSLRFAVPKGLLLFLATCVLVKITVSLMYFYAPFALAGLIAPRAPDAGPVMIIQIIRYQEFLNHIGGQVCVRFPRVLLFTVA